MKEEGETLLLQLFILRLYLHSDTSPPMLNLPS